MVTKWEYKIDVLPLNDFNSFQEKLDKIGKEGWELVSIVQSPLLKSSLRIKSDHFGIFKKPQI